MKNGRGSSRICPGRRDGDDRHHRRLRFAEARERRHRGRRSGGLDDTAKQVNVPGTGRYPIGTAIEAAGNGATLVRVRLDGVATSAA